MCSESAYGGNEGVGERYYFSIVMAAYNSEDTIGKALRSIRNQKFDQEKIEILVVDGGSSDRTIEIANEYGATVLENPYRLPEPAKMIGLQYATGRYLCIMDSDEEAADDRMFEKRRKLLDAHKELKCLAIGFATPRNSGACCHYINMVGDPFSCFVYRTLKDSMEGLIIRKGRYYPDLESYIAEYAKNDIKPIGDSGVVMDLDYLKAQYSTEFEQTTTAALFDRIITDTGFVGFMAGDRHVHNTNASFQVFFRKLKFRIINNIFDVNGSGYAKKAGQNAKLSRRSYLFPLYAISVLFPLIDGVRMTVNYKHWIFLLHPVFSLYVLIEIGYQYFCKMIGVKRKNSSYAK